MTLPTFRYTAMTESGAQTSGTLQAASEQAAMRILKESHPAVIKLSRVQGIESRSPGRKIKEKDLAVLCAQLAIILSSGLPIVRAVELVANQTRSKALQTILRQSAVDVTGGIPLAQALQKTAPPCPSLLLRPYARERSQARSMRPSGGWSATMTSPPK